MSTTERPEEHGGSRGVEDPLSQGSPGSPARGRGPASTDEPTQEDYQHPSAGWGAAVSVGKVLSRTREPIRGARAIRRMNHEDGGFECPGCAWPDDRKGLHLDICENGIKHVTWEMTQRKVTSAFFARHTVSELAGWSDFDLEDQGRLTEPMAYDAASDTYRPVSWETAFSTVGEALRGLDSPDQAAFYTSGRLGNEATFLYQLWVREYGTNNLPDCSNMCHEASGRALTASLGTGKGTADLVDWDRADAILLLGVNAASNAPRMLTSLANAHRRGATVVHVNPLREAASRRTIVPHELVSMGTMHATPTGDLDVQVKIGGDMALMRGVAKAVLEAAEHDPGAVDADFLARHTSGFEDYRRVCAETGWEELERKSGVSRRQIHELADVYLASRSVIISWCLGVAQQEQGVDAVREIVNVLLLRGNLGREGAGPSPVRGHSNVQGNRTCGIDNNPTPEFLDRLADACGITPPRTPGLGTVGVVEAMNRGEVKVFVGMGGNFALAAPDTAHTATGLRSCDLTVHVSTKLNRSHLVHGRQALILPCLARTEVDVQESGEQGITVEDSMSMVHLSYGMNPPASPGLLSEPAIIAGMARATLPDSRTPWSAYVADYDTIRETMTHALEGFEAFNRRVRQPLGFRIRQAARELVFHTPTGKAEFGCAPVPEIDAPAGRLMLSTMRSHDQWNTTIYSNNDRYRGLANLRTVVFMHPDDLAERGLAAFDPVDVTSFAKDGSTRSVYGYRAVPYDIPRGNAAGYMPELNVLCPIGDFSPGSDQPMMKQVTVAVEAARPSRVNEPGTPGAPG